MELGAFHPPELRKMSIRSMMINEQVLKSGESTANVCAFNRNFPRFLTPEQLYKMGGTVDAQKLLLSEEPMDRLEGSSVAAIGRENEYTQPGF
jgi:hypothetical protein